MEVDGRGMRQEGRAGGGRARGRAAEKYQCARGRGARLSFENLSEQKVFSEFSFTFMMSYSR